MSKIPLVLLPGMLCDAFYWRDQIADLDDVAECTVADYGERDSFIDMAETILRNTPPRFALASHSMGGRVAFEMLRAAPERIVSLGLFGTAYRARPTGPEGDAEELLRRTMIDTARAHGMRALGEQWVKRMVHPDRLGERALVDPIVDMVERRSFKVLNSQIHASLTRRDATDLLPQIRCPTLILVGRQDAPRPVPPHEEMAREIPNSTLTILEDCGHMSMLERPREVSNAMRSWLRSTAS